MVLRNSYETEWSICDMREQGRFVAYLWVDAAIGVLFVDALSATRCDRRRRCATQKRAYCIWGAGRVRVFSYVSQIH